MHTGIRYSIDVNEFAFFIGFDMVFVSVITLAVLFCPTSIRIFLLQLVWFFFPLIWSFTFFDLLVFFSAVALNRNFHERGIYDFSLVGNEIFLLQFFLEQVKYFFLCIVFDECFSEKPNCFGIGYFIAQAES